MALPVSYIPHVIDSLMRCKDWEASFEDFIRVNCPRFRSFDSEYASNGSGMGLDVQLASVHSEYLSLVESLLSTKLSEIGIDSITFLQSMKDGWSSQNEVSSRVLSSLDQYSDFFEFGSMMQAKYQSIYETQATVTPIIMPVAAPTELSLSAHGSFVRVLWDIENIRVPKKLGGLNTVQLLRSHLLSQGVVGPGTDLRMTAFFNPDSGVVHKTCIAELDKAAVEIVWVSAKREDADRKLGARVDQEMKVLPPHKTTFVLISSDQDFRHQVQLMVNSGFPVVVIHDAPPQSQWRQVLELQATKSFLWRDIVNGTPHPSDTPAVASALTVGGSKPTGSATAVSATAPVMQPTAPKQNPSRKGGGRGKRQDDSRGNTSSHKGLSPEEAGTLQGGDEETPTVPEITVTPNKVRGRIAADIALANASAAADEAESGVVGVDSRDSPTGDVAVWIPCSCYRWQGAFGFLDIDPASPPAEPSDGTAGKTERVFVHHSLVHIDGEPQRSFLHKGERVLAVFESTAKGLRATKLRVLPPTA